MGRAGFDDNNNPTLLALSNDGLRTPVELWADPVTHGLVTSGGGGGGGSVTISSPIGQTTKSASVSVTLASDQGTLPVQDTVAESSLNTISTNQTNGAQQTKLTNGTNISDVVANDSGYNGVSVNNATKTLSFSTSAAGAQNLLANTDCRGYSSIIVVTTSVGSGLAWNGQFSPNSGGTYITTPTWADKTSSLSNITNLSTGNNKISVSPVLADYFQLAVTALTSGTLSGYVILSTMPVSPQHVLIGGAGGSAFQVPNVDTPSGDAMNGSHQSMDVIAFQAVYTGSGNTWSRFYGITPVSALASSARTTATASSDQTNFNWKGVRFILNVTAASGTGGLQLQVQGKDSISGNYYQINTSPTAVTATGTYVYDVYPGAPTAQAGITQATSSLIPHTFRCNVAVGDGSSYTYSVSYEGIL